MRRYGLWVRTVSAGLGGLYNPYAMIIGPDGKLYVSTNSGSGVYRYDLVTGIPLPARAKLARSSSRPGTAG